jgi:hypothetical protein
MIDSGAMPSNKKKASHSDQESSYALGDRVKVNLHTGRLVDATIKAIIERTLRLSKTYLGAQFPSVDCEPG